jgi:sugar lactone lactonase YvrE
MFNAAMSKTTTAIVSLLVVACVFALARWLSVVLAASGIPAFVFLVLVLILTLTGMGSGKSRRRGTPGKRRMLRCAAPALLVVLAPALLWAIFGTSFQGLVTVLPTGGITLASPGDVIVDSLGNLYIADTSNNQIVEVTAAGVASALAFPGLSPALHDPAAVALDGAGNLYVADANNSRVVELSAGGVTSVVNTSSLLSYPDGVVLDASGNLYIADAVNNDIVEVPAGGAAAVLAITGLGTPLNSPDNVAVDAAGNLYIADPGNNRIVVVAPGGAGTVLSITGGVTLSGPLGVTVDSLGNIYIADRNNNRIVTVPPGGGAGNVINTGSTTLHFPLAVAVSVSGAVYINDNNGSSRIVEVQPTAVGFGHLPLQTVSGTTLTLPFTIGFGVTFGSVQAFTQGTASLDFTVASTTCVSGTTTNGACTVTITFLPTAGGLRRGAVVIYNNGTPNLPILTVPIYGFGDAPLAGLAPNAGTVISTGGVALSNPFQVALDGSGNIYVGDYTGSNVTRIPAGGGTATRVTLGTPGSTAVQNITGVAIDGAGNLFIGDHQNSRILVVTPGGVVSVLTINGLSPVLGFPVALAFDAAGNLYISDFTTGRIIRVSTLVVVGSTSSGLGAVIATGTFAFTGSTLTGMTVDAQGNTYIAARTQNSSSIIKVTTTGVASALSFPGITPAISDPQGVAVDAMGNIYVVDTGNSRIVRLTTAGVASALSISVLPAPSTLGSTLFGVTLDPAGNLYIPDWTNNRIVFVNVSGAALNFANTKVGFTSSDSPKISSVTNLGNQPLVFSASPGFTADFSQPTGSTNQCLSATSLADGTVCNVSVQFTPQSVGSLSAGITVSDNTLNMAGSTQQVSVSGTGLTPGDTTATAVSANPTSANVGQPLTLNATVTDTAAGHSSTHPTGGVTFTDTVGSTVVSLNGGSPVTLVAGAATLTGVTLSGAGTHTIAANYAGVSGSFIASSNTTALVVSKTPAVVAGPSTQPVQIVHGQAGSVPLSVTGPYSGLAVPTGSISYNVLNASNTSVASGSATLTGGSADSTTTIPVANSLASGSYTVTASYGGDSNYAASSTATTIQLVVGQVTPTISWTPPSTAITYGTTLTALLDASAATGSTTVPGTFAYTATLAGGSPVTVTSATVLGAGTYTLTATFTPTDTSTYTSASATVALTVAKATPAVALAASGNPVLAATAITFTATVSSSAGTPSGSVSFYDGSTLLGSGTLALGVAHYATSSLAVGSHSITAVYGGDGNFSALTSAVLTEVLTETAPTAITTTTTLTASPDPLSDGQPATLAATVTPAPTGTPAGIISFYSGTTLLGTSTLNASGVATFTTSGLVVGADSITAVYPGNAGFAASTSSALSETVTAAYTVTAPTTPVPVAPGGAATINITVPPVGGPFDSVVTLSATGLPPGARATFNPPMVTPGSSGAPTVLTIQLATLASSNSARDIPASPQRLPALPFRLAFAVFGAVFAAVPGRKRIPRTLALAVTLAVLGIATSLVTGCGGGFANTPSTPAGNYTVTVTGTSGSFQASTTVTLAVQ